MKAGLASDDDRYNQLYVRRCHSIGEYRYSLTGVGG